MASSSNSVDVRNDEINIDAFNSLIAADLDRDVTFSSFEEAVLASGFTEDQLTVASPYRVITDKNELLAKPFFISSVRFSRDKMSERPFVVLYCITKDNEQVIVTDGSTGIMRDIVAEVAKRVDAGRERPMEGFLIPNGLRVSTYALATDEHGVQQPALPGEKITGEASTFYLK